MQFGKYSFSEESVVFFQEHSREVAEQREEFKLVPAEVWDLIYPEKEVKKTKKVEK